MTLLCITNEMTDARSCTHKDLHAVNCDGFEYRYSEEHRRDETTGRLCDGCRPREARKGMLCSGCWFRVEQAFADWTPEREVTLLSIDRAVKRDNGGVRSGPEGYVPIPGTALAVDEIRSYLRSFTGNAGAWVSTSFGAADAVRFARAVPAALRTHELEEKAHRIKRTRCSECRQLTLIWHPAAAIGQEVTVKCSNPECGHQLDQDEYEVAAEVSDLLTRRRKATA